MHRPSDRDVNWMSPVQGKSPTVQVKEPYGNLDIYFTLFRYILRAIKNATGTSVIFPINHQLDTPCLCTNKRP